MASARTFLALLARVAVGPLAVLGFFGAWCEGWGPFAGIEFSGLRLITFAGSLGVFDPSPAEHVGLWAVRLGALGVVIAGLWQLALAPVFPWHRGYLVSGAYLCVAALVIAAARLWQDGIAWPPIGAVMVMASALLFAAARIASPPQAGVRG